MPPPTNSATLKAPGSSVLPAAQEKRGHPIRLAVVGGNFGAGVARRLAEGNRFVELVAVCDSDRAKAHALADELDVRPYSNMAELLDDDGWRPVGLFTPPVGRAKLIRKVIRAGRHVMTTKPFETDLAEARAVLAEAGEAGLAIHMNSPAPVPAEDIAQIHTWVREHDLGTPIALRAETWANYRESANGSWYDDPALCPCAPIFRLGIYFLNDFAALLGTPECVHVMQSRLFTGRPTSDNAQISIRYESGALANVFASFCISDGHPYSDRITLNYERGSIIRWMHREENPDMSLDRAVTELHLPDHPALTTISGPGKYAGWYDWDSFQRAVRSESPAALQDPAQVLFGMRLLDAMRRSSLTGLPEIVA